MSPTETDVLAFWREHTDSMGFPPSRRKAAAFFDVAQSNIDHIVRELHGRGLMAAGGTGHLADAITTRGRAVLRDAEAKPIPYVPTSPRVTLTIEEAKCSCGASHFRIGHVRCFGCERRASA